VTGKGAWYLAAFAATAMMATLGVFVREVSPDNDYTIVLGRFGIGLICLLIWQGVSQAREKRFYRRDAEKSKKQNRTRMNTDEHRLKDRKICVYLRNLCPDLSLLSALSASLRFKSFSWALIGSGVMMPLFVICYIKAVLSGPITNAAFLLYLGPLIASSLAALWLREGFNRISGLLLGGALLGTLFITEFRLPNDPDQAESLVFGLLSGLFYGLFLLLNNRKIQGETSRLTATVIQFTVATLFMIPIAAAAGMHITRADWPWLIGIGVIHGFLALTLVIASLGHLKTVEYGTLSYGEPVMAAILGVAAYGEHISALQIVGCLLVLVAGIARVVARR
jgi:drug/metabolite transporter (DMT)-like permease